MVTAAKFETRTGWMGRYPEETHVSPGANGNLPPAETAPNRPWRQHPKHHAAFAYTKELVTQNQRG